MIEVLLADDRAVVRDGLRVLLEAQADVSVVGDAANGREEVRLATQLHPDVVVMDIAMPELNGIEANAADSRCVGVDAGADCLDAFDDRAHLSGAAGRSAWLPA